MTMDLEKEKISFDEFTLEKFKVVERLQNLEVQVSRLVAHIDSEQGTVTRFHADLNRILEEIKFLVQKHDRIIMGDENPGLNIKVDRLERSSDERDKHQRDVWVAILGIFTILIAELIFYFITKH